MWKNGLILLLAVSLIASLTLRQPSQIEPSPVEPTNSAPAWEIADSVVDRPKPEPPQPSPLVLTDPSAPPAPHPVPAAPEPEEKTAPADTADDPLTAIIAAASAEEPGLAGAAIGFCVFDADGTVRHQHLAHTAQIPASSLKTLTTATALETLGADFRFETHLSATAAPGTDGRLAGDLILRGGGDPSLSIDQLRNAAAQLAASGLTAIDGRIIGDGDLGDGSLFPDFWNWGDIGNGYGSPVSGLNLEHNRFSAAFSPGPAVGEPATLIGTAPALPPVLTLHNHVVTGPAGSGDGVTIYGGERTPHLHLRGTVPLDAGQLAVTGAVTDPELFAAHHLHAELIAAGIAVTGAAHGATALRLAGESIPAAPHALGKIPSPALIELVTSIHATSDNLETECLYRQIGRAAKLDPAEAIRRHWADRGLVFAGLRLVDGSGLSRAGHITPHDLARLQQLTATGPAGEAYLGSLLATEDGRLRWKAGAMSAIRAYTGQALTEDGTAHYFALIVNHFEDLAAVNRLRDALLAALQTGAPENPP